MNRPIGAPSKVRGSFITERASGGGAGVEAAPYNPRHAAARASAAQNATRNLRPSELRDVPRRN